MALVSQEPKKFDIPDEPGQFMMIRKVSWAVLKKAREANVDEGVAKAKKVGGELMESFTRMAGIRAQVAEAEAQLAAEKKGGDDGEAPEADPYDPDNYDTGIILENGIREWSYEGKPDRSSIAELDEPAAVWAKKTILEYSRPRGEEEKKGS